jgi:hypothetical protein
MSKCQLAVLFILYDHQWQDSLQGKLLMSLTYGYDLKDDDKMLEAPIQTVKLVAPLVLPGAALVNHFPFCAPCYFISSHLVISHSCL